MLTRLILGNYRCFEDHVIEFGPMSVVVGANNAGKTTIAEALRLVAVVTERYRALTYVRPPSGLGLSQRTLGCRPSFDGLRIRFDTVFHRYSVPPCRGPS